MIIGVDIGGTSIKAGVVDQDGTVVKIDRVKTPKTQEEFVQALVKLIHGLWTEFSGQITAIGIGCPGPLDAKNGVILKTPNTPQMTDLKTPLQHNFDVPIFFDNDANCFTLAEALYGAGKDHAVVLGITLGTGFGAGLVMNDIIYSGRGNALELAHAVINKEETIVFPNLVCGCVEQYVSTAGVLFSAKKYDLDVLEPIDVFQLAEVKNDKALAVWKEFGWHLGIALTNAVCSFDPDVIVIGGQMNQAWQYFEEAMQESLEKHCIHPTPLIVRATIKEAGIVGASLLIR